MVNESLPVLRPRHVGAGKSAPAKRWSTTPSRTTRMRHGDQEAQKDQLHG